MIAAAVFEIDAASGALSFNPAPDFEAPGDGPTQGSNTYILQRYRNYLFADLPDSSGALYARAGLAYWKLIKIGNHIATCRCLAASAHTVGVYVVGAHTMGTFVVGAHTVGTFVVSARTVSAHIVIGTYSI